MVKILKWRVLDAISIFIIILALVVIIGWTTNTEFFQLFSKESTYTTLLCSAFVLFLSLWNALNKVSKYIGTGALKKNLAEAVYLQCSGGKIKNLSIIAVTTGKILPLFSSSGIHIDNCTLILPYFDKAKKGSKEERNNTRCSEFISQWYELQASGRIKNLEIIRAPHWPDVYMCIADNSSLIAGFYNYKLSGDVEHGVAANFSDAIFVNPINENSRQLFYFYREFFEKTKENYGVVE